MCAAKASNSKIQRPAQSAAADPGLRRTAEGQRVTCSGCRRRQRECKIDGFTPSARVVGALQASTPRWIMHLAPLVLVLALLAVPLTTEAQQAGKLWRVGYLSSSSAERERARLAAFQQGLRELGYVEGKSIFIDMPEESLKGSPSWQLSWPVSRSMSLSWRAPPQPMRPRRRVMSLPS